MKFSAARETLLKPLQTVVGVVERRQTMPILSNVLLSVAGLEAQHHRDGPRSGDGRGGRSESGRDGEITVPGRKLHDIFRALPDGSERRDQSQAASG